MAIHMFCCVGHHRMPFTNLSRIQTAETESVHSRGFHCGHRDRHTHTIYRL
jgi:hypothetical protein